jgi:hypothetical protein
MQTSEVDCIVKLRFSKIIKRCKNGKRVYRYEQVSLNFPKELHSMLQCLRNRQLEIKASRVDKIICIQLIDKGPLDETAL